jgi:hypothetical protein
MCVLIDLRLFWLKDPLFRYLLYRNDLEPNELSLERLFT